MTRSFILFAGCCLFGACAAPKAEVVEDTPSQPAPVKPAEPAPSVPDPPPARSPLRLPPGFDSFPDDKEFRTGIAPAPQGGAPVISAPPAAE